MLKYEITVCFLWLSLPAHEGSLMRIYLKEICLVHPLSFECLQVALKGTFNLYFYKYTLNYAKLYPIMDSVISPVHVVVMMGMELSGAVYIDT